MLGFPTCPICIESFDEFDNIAACACGHTFHYDCIVDWAKKCRAQRKPSLCPTCKGRFEISASRGIVKRLFFSFESTAKSTPGIDATALKEQEEISRELIAQIEAHEKDFSGLKKSFEQAESALEYGLDRYLVLEAKLKDAEGELENLRKENTVLKRVLKEIANLSLNAPNLTSLSDEAVPLNMLASSSPISSNTSGAYSLEVSMSAPCPSLRDDRPGFDYQPEKPRQEAKSKGIFRRSLPIHSAFFKYLVGPLGSTKDHFQNKTKTTIQIPPRGTVGIADVVVVGADRDDVENAEREILSYTDSIRMTKMTPTHFIAFSLRPCGVKNAIPQSFHHGTYPWPGFDVAKIGTMTLLSGAEEEQAKEALHNCGLDIIEPMVILRSFRVTLKFVEREVVDSRVKIRAKVNDADPSEWVQYIANTIVDYLRSLDLMHFRIGDVNMGVTLFDNPLEFNGTRMSEDFYRHFFGDFEINEVHLCRVDGARNFTSVAHYAW